MRSLEAIGKAVCECRCVLPVLSSKRVESKWCTDELGLAYSNRKMLFPVTCEPFEQIKLSYADKLILNGVQWECAAGNDSDARLQVLIGRIKKALKVDGRDMLARTAAPKMVAKTTDLSPGHGTIHEK